MRVAVTFVLAFCLLATVANASFLEEITNPTITVKLDHPPDLGLKIERLAFGPYYGRCSDQIVDAVISDFVSSEIEVIDRHHLDAILTEHDLAFSGYVDETTAAKIGNILGPSALVFIKAQRCTTERDRLQEEEEHYTEEKGEYIEIKYIARTRAFLKASIQTVDLTTGRIFAARNLEYSPVRQNESYDGYPEAPSEFDIIDIAIQDAVNDIHRMFLPWTEHRELIYFNNDKCGLKRAFKQLRSGDKEGAQQTSLENLESCKQQSKVKPKVLAHAYYNVGMGYRIQGDHDEAMEYFREAERIRPGKLVRKAIADCQRAKELKLEMLKVEEQATIASEDRQAEFEAEKEAEQSSTLTNADVIKMAEAGLPETIIIAKIESSKSDFDTSTDALLKLVESGVSEKIITSMVAAGAQ